MDHIDLTVSTGYVPGWGFWEGVRELVQNGIDRERETKEGRDPVQRVMSKYRLSIVYDEEDNQLVITNAKTKLDRRTILLGEGSKRPMGKTIGQHGEGYKLGLLALVRAGHLVTILNGNEAWRPEIVKHEVLGAKVLRIGFEELPGDSGVLQIEIEGVTPEQWALVQDRVRWLHEPDEEIDGKDGTVLVGPDEMGRLYVGGLFVRELHERFLYGYDFHPDVVHLDRDRGTVDSFDLTWAASRMLSEAGLGNERFVLSALYSGKQDVEYLLRHTGESLSKVEEIAFQEFKEVNGPTAWPVSNEYDANYVRENYANVRPVVTSDNLAKVIKESRGWREHVEGLQSIDQVTPATVLRDFLDAHKSEFSQQLADEFAEELIERAEEEGWIR